MLISCVLQCTDGLRLIKRLENYAYRMSEKTAYRSLEKSAYRSLKKLLTVHLQIHLTACTLPSITAYATISEEIALSSMSCLKPSRIPSFTPSIK